MAALTSIRRRPLCRDVQLALALSLAAGSTQSGVVTTLSLPLSSPHNLRLDGVAADDRSGGSVSGAGDINGDGLDDLIVGADSADPSGNTKAGSTYVVFLPIFKDGFEN